MAGYSIRKFKLISQINITKKLTLNVQKYTVDPTILYFDVEEDQIPFVMDYNDFFKQLNENIKNRLIREMEYDDGVLNVVSLEGNVTKNYCYYFEQLVIELL